MIIIYKLWRVEPNRFIGFQDMDEQADGRTGIILFCIIDTNRITKIATQCFVGLNPHLQRKHN